MADKKINLIVSLIDQTRGDLETLTKKVDALGKTSDQTSKQTKKVGDSMYSIGNIAAGIISANVITQLTSQVTGFFQDSSRASEDFNKAMTTLEIIAPRFGQSADIAKKKADELGRELRIGPQAAAESLQNLLKSGLNLDQAADLIKRFTNEAITGKSPTITLAQAVQNLSFAYSTGNSALGNLSGISENFVNIQERGLEILKKEDKGYRDLLARYDKAKKSRSANTDKLAEELAQYEKNLEGQAKYRGMIELTNLTMGSAEKFTGSLTDKQAQLEQKMNDIRLKVGEPLNRVLADFTDLLIRAADGIGGMLAPALETLAKAYQFLGKNPELLNGALAVLVTLVTPTLISNVVALGAAVGGAAVGFIAANAPLLVLAGLLGTIVTILSTPDSELSPFFLQLKLGFQEIGKMGSQAIQGIIGWVNDLVARIGTAGADIEILAQGAHRELNRLFGRMDEVDRAQNRINELEKNKNKIAVDAGWVQPVMGPVNQKAGQNFFNTLPVSQQPTAKQGVNPFLPKLAHGSDYFNGGWAMVGEHGAELVRLPRGSQVFPNSETERMVNSNNRNVNINVYGNTNPMALKNILDFQLMTAA